MQQIYSKYKERFIEISGKNRSLFTKSIIKKYSYDLGALLEYADIDDFYDFLWHRKPSFTIINEKIGRKLERAFVKENTEETPSEKTQVDKHFSDLKYLKREVEEIQKETGKYDLCIGFPYVFGKINSDIPLKAPLLLFPVTLEIDKDVVIVTHIPSQPVSINKSLVLAYCKEHHIKTDEVKTEFDLSDNDSFETIYDIVEYLNNNGFKIKYTKRKGTIPFDNAKEIDIDGMELKNMAILGRFPLANPIYNDYIQLEKNNLSTPSIDLLISGRPIRERRRAKAPITYTINDLDYAQENAIEKINESSNLVIYGPPGTGKSQTIVNIISDALCKNRRVLVVSQKQAALDVVFSRLGKLNAKAMLIPDPEKDKVLFFEKIKQAHAQVMRDNFADNTKKYQSYEFNINKELGILQSIGDVLFSETDFGITLQEMYAQSYNVGKDTKDYLLYKDLITTPISDWKYHPLYDDIKYIIDKNLCDLFIRRADATLKNPMVAHVRDDLDMHRLREAYDFINKIVAEQNAPFDFSIYPHSRYLTTFYLERQAENRMDLSRIADIITKMEHPGLAKTMNTCLIPPLTFAYPFVRKKYSQYKKDVEIDLNVSLKGLQNFEKRFVLLQDVLDEEGYSLAIGGVLNGNYTLLKNLSDALENYVTIRDMNKTIGELSESVKLLLDFSYIHSDKTLHGIRQTIEKILPLRIYHEIIKNDAYIENKLSQTVAFDSVRERILTLKSDQRELTKTLALERFSLDYAQFFENDSHAKDYLYQIQKQRALWPIRRMMEYFSEFIFRLFPCWLLSPQTVSTIFPLKRGMFDLIVFDEASQMFIENALPTIYRGNNIVVAGDNKQLRPSSGFIKRYQADDSFDATMDLSTQAALEVESLLDLATAKYTPVNLVYHYRSKFAELIDFSNMAFYGNKLQIAPNITIDTDHPPIERIKVKGVWQNRHNHEEAVAVVKLVRSILREREYGETIGIVTFNSEQKEYIEDMLDAEADKVATFRRQLYLEQNRIENGENQSLFVKNLENVQGDERDIIIFSVGYAKNDYDRVVAQFGSLSMEGGENRLNVAITRAKKKIYVVTSIEPEELDKVETTKNNGPKLLKSYLMYARAVSSGKQDEAKRILASFDGLAKPSSEIGSYEEQIKEGLEKMGYTVYSNLGNTYYKLSLGIYDKTLNRFILGIECDYRAYQSSDNALERDVYRIKFLESRGWKIIRVWSRDWWQSPKKVLSELSSIIDAEREKLLKNLA
ncbi:MAG: DUF4011 domain-containing protein [Clostridia bacterium]|nr:DUF4011 domain-containing protein [Clostridia bacterium]